MKHSVKVGFSFGVTSGIITTLGLLVGLFSSTHSKFVVLGGILTIAIADALSDAFGIHISEESEQRHTTKQVWTSTISTFLSKAVFALTFMVPVLLFELSTAVIISIIWGLFVLSILSLSISNKKKKRWRALFEHLMIAIVVIIVTFYIGKLVALVFGAV